MFEEKFAMQMKENVSAVGAGDDRKDSSIQRSRLILLIFLGLEVAFFGYYLPGFILLYNQANRQEDDERRKSQQAVFLPAMITCFICTVGLILNFFMVKKLVRQGIRLFAWWNLVQLIFAAIYTIVISILITVAPDRSHLDVDNHLFVLIFTSILGVLTIPIVTFSFGLEKRLN